MDCQDYITTKPERKQGEHLGPQERSAIQRLRKLRLSRRAIAP
jgi:IS30 family transposase